MAVVTAALLASSVASANTSFPYADSFENYAPGTGLADGTNWYGGISTALVVRAMSNTYPLRFPLASATHSNVVELVEPVTNVIDHAGGDTNVWVDYVVFPVRSSTQPKVDDDIQMAMYLNSNGNIVVRHSWFKKDENSFVRQWTTLDHPGIPTDKWVRVTIKLDYLTGDVFGDGTSMHRFFQISLNGGQPLTNQYAIQQIPTAEIIGGLENPLDAWQFGGTWFGLVDQTWNPGDSTKLSSLSLRGTGFLDDLVVTNGNVLTFPGTTYTIKATATAGGTIYPGGELVVNQGQDLTFSGYAMQFYYLDDVLVDGVSINPPGTNAYSYTFNSVTANHTIHAAFTYFGPTYTTKGVDHDWMDDFNLTDYETDQMLDQDADGALTWEEYVAGTDPTDSNSVFRILSVSYEATQNVVKWYATTDSNVLTPFSMLRCTNLTADATNAWFMVATNDITRVSGTNQWTDVNPPTNSPAYYRPIVLWPY